MIIVLGIGVIVLALAAWFLWELFHAPLMDEQGKVIMDEQEASAKLYPFHQPKGKK